MRLNAIVASIITVAAVVGASSATASAATEDQTDISGRPGSINVAVQPGDTLAKIGEAHSTTYVRIYNANPSIADPDLIYAGESVRIPAADEQLAERPLPEAVKAAAAATPQVAQPAPKKLAPKSVVKTKVAPVTTVSDGSVWDRLAQCEAGGNWSINTGNGFYGGLQFTLSSWRAVGGSGYPNQASREEQIARGQMLQARQGWGAWPACSSKLGLR